MTLLRWSPLLLPATLALLAGCSGSRDDTSATPPPARAPELSMPDSEEGLMIAVDRPDWSTEVTSVEIPLPTDRDYPPGYWAIVARDLDRPVPEATPAPAAGAAATAPDPATPAAPAAPAEQAAPAPVPATTQASPTPGSGTPLPAATANSVRAGVLLVPRIVHASSVHDRPGRYLFAMPLAFQPDPGFATPLNRISVAVDLASGSGFGLIAIPHIGVFGLRHGPLPAPDGPVSYAFRADQFDALVRMKGTPQRGGWRMNGYDGGPSPTHQILYGVLETASGARETDAVVRVALRFTPGDEALVQAADIHLHIVLGGSEQLPPAAGTAGAQAGKSAL